MTTSPRAASPGGRTPAKTERNAALVAAYRDGATKTQLAARFGVCFARVCQLIARAGRPARPGPVRPVSDGERDFPSVAAAARAHGMSKSAAWDRANRGCRGWRFLGPPVAAALLLLAAGRGSARAHDLFANLRSPNGQLCCGDIDCKPVDECVLPDRHQGLVIEGACTAIPPGTTLGMASPDGQAHACYGHTNGVPFVRCAILPGDV